MEKIYGAVFPEGIGHQNLDRSVIHITIPIQAHAVGVGLNHNSPGAHKRRSQRCIKAAGIIHFATVGVIAFVLGESTVIVILCHSMAAVGAVVYAGAEIDIVRLFVGGNVGIPFFVKKHIVPTAADAGGKPITPVLIFVSIGVLHIVLGIIENPLGGVAIVIAKGIFPGSVGIVASTVVTMCV